MTGRMTIAEAARRYRIPYALLWRALHGGFVRPPPLSPEMEERLRAALEELQRREEAGDAA